MNKRIKRRKKGIALKVVAEILIAIVAAFVILSIFQSLIPLTGGSAICRIYRVILTLPIPPSIKPTIKECTIQPETERFILTETEKAKIVDALAVNTMKCWHEKANDGKSGITFICYEIFIKKTEEQIGEKDLNVVFQQKGYCNILPNNFLDVERVSFTCGDLNKVYWQAESINGTDITIIIKYNAFQHRIEII
jgi:hypothetical protein